MARSLLLVVAALIILPVPGYAQTGTAPQSAEPYKVGTFATGTSQWVGLVLRDRFVVELAQANATLEKARSWPRRAMPADMVALIADYESGLKGRIYAIVNDVVQSNALTGTRPGYIREVAELRTLAPIPRPRMIMNAAVNFYSHIAENAPAEERARQIAARKANRGVPYMFLKAPSSVIGTGETILIPYGRTELDWEIEVATVIGKTARYVAAPRAQDHVFGYTVMLDISDRGGRPPGGFSAGTDWFVMKGQDTFGPMGPFIVPKEFYGDPMVKLKQTLLVGSDQRQQSDASDMIHSVWEVIEYASSLVTLQPGDVIGAGTSGGVGMGTSVRGEQVWLVAGDEITATIDGLGTLRHKVAAAPAPPAGTGSYLPPVSSYRGRGRGGRGALAPAGPQAQTPSPAQATTAAPYFAEKSMNVFRRFNGDGVKTLEFYGQVLGFGDIGAVGGVSRYQVGPSQLKFTRAGANAKFTRGGINDAAGVRLWTMWFPDEEALTKRFAARGYPAPVFKTIDGLRSALVADPDGEWVQLVVVPNAPKDTYDRLEIGIAANDLEKSRAFYRTFVGLEELPPVKDAVLGITKYPFRNGSTTVSVWATQGPKPVNRQLAGIQYVVKPVDPIWALAQQRGIPVEQPLGETLPGLVTTWLYDPDQVTNYFAEIRPRPRAAQVPAR